MTRSLLLAMTLLLAACREPDMVAPPPDPQQITYAPELDVHLDKMIRTASGLYYEDIRVGEGELAEEGDTVRLLYAGYLPNGTLLEARRIPSEAAPVVLGSGDIIAGWEEGIRGMRAGGIRKLVVPPQLGFGRIGRPPVPPNAIVVFDIEILPDAL
jgi:FKBP-type peptidyl-prolyl cis-trans isomerase